MLLHICSCFLVSLVYCKNVGAVVTSLFYEDILKTFGSCGVSIWACQQRKVQKCGALTCSTWSSKGQILMNFDAFLHKLLLGAMPWCFDDPDDAEQLQKVLLCLGETPLVTFNPMVPQGLFQWQQQISTSWMSLLLEMKGLKSCISKCSVHNVSVWTEVID